jgi:hypothetical protein
VANPYATCAIGDAFAAKAASFASMSSTCAAVTMPNRSRIAAKNFAGDVSPCAGRAGAVAAFDAVAIYPFGVERCCRRAVTLPPSHVSLDVETMLPS